MRGSDGGRAGAAGAEVEKFGVGSARVGSSRTGSRPIAVDRTAVDFDLEEAP